MTLEQIYAGLQALKELDESIHKCKLEEPRWSRRYDYKTGEFEEMKTKHEYKLNQLQKQRAGLLKRTI